MWIYSMIDEYEQGKKQLNQLLKTLSESELDQLDKKQINGMIRDMNFSLDWLKSGREPGTLRGIDRRSVYQRNVLMDMDLFPSLDIEYSKKEISEIEKQAIVDILVVLSVRERQCFVLYHAYCMSMAEIGKELDIEKTTVQTFLERADKKIQEKIVSYECRIVAN